MLTENGFEWRNMIVNESVPDKIRGYFSALSALLLLSWREVGSSDPVLDAINIDTAVDQLLGTLRDLEKQSVRNKLVVKDLTRQTLMNRFQAEERIRSEGDSGIVQVRYDKLGSRNYHHTTFIGNSFVAVHDHSDTIDTCGLGEFIGILNGVEFRTRHNDYRLVMPSRTSKKWHAYDEIPTPPVPRSVLDKPTLQPVHNKVTSGWPSVRPERQWGDSNPRQNSPCRFQGGYTSHCANDAPERLQSDVI
ncbi:hypothetical protein PoB_003107700 [Plakobranchus ocellatus]|uniref:Uncharacterized protein n=1 Tax=Plakobranchus ocellatus TaxID=259542 RepID=A0AAV4ACF4_9GAST|nr:hypothetical protein PoB_003107700 [Plakobranchus ocellatus]